MSDAHKGLSKAIRESFIGCSWQRCKVHMMRNVLAHIPSRDIERFAAKLKQIWLQPDYKSAVSYAEHFMNPLLKLFENHRSTHHIAVKLLKQLSEK